MTHHPAVQCVHTLGLRTWQQQHQSGMAHVLSIPEMNDPQKASRVFTLAARGQGPKGPTVQQVKSMAMVLYVLPAVIARAQSTGHLSAQDQLLLTEMTAPFQSDALDKQARQALSRKDLAALDQVIAQFQALESSLLNQGNAFEASTVRAQQLQIEAARPGLVYTAPPAVPHPDKGRVPAVVVPPSPKQPRVPDDVAAVVQRLSIAPAIARTAMNAFGTQVSTPDLVFYLEQVRGIPKQSAQELVNTIRQVKAQSDEAIVAWAKHLRTLGRVVTEQDYQLLDWDRTLRVQADLDTRGHRALIDVLFDPQVQFDFQLRLRLHRYLRRCGYEVAQIDLRLSRDDPVRAVDEAKRQTLASSLTALNVPFSRLVLRTGRVFQAPAEIGLIDGGFDVSHGAIALNTRTTRVGDERYRAASERNRQTEKLTNDTTAFADSADHGTAMVGLALNGKRRWVNMSVVTTPMTLRLWHTSPFGTDIDHLVREGAGVIGVSLSPGNEMVSAAFRKAFENHANVLFVVATYANQAVHTSQFPDDWRQWTTHANVLLIGNVNLTNRVNADAAYGPTLSLNALGSDRQIPMVGGGYAGYAGSSNSTQAVVNNAASIRFLAPTLPISGIRQILKLTSKIDPRSTLAPEIFPMQGVVQGDDADKVAAMVGLVLEQRRPEQWQISGPGRAPGEAPQHNYSRTRWHAAPATDPVTPEEAARIVGLSAQDQERLLPIAKQVLADHPPSRLVAAVNSQQPR
jgi:hypothetical protein